MPGTKTTIKVSKAQYAKIKRLEAGRKIAKAIEKKYKPKPSTTALAKKAYSLAVYNNKIARGSYQTNLHKQRIPIKVSIGEPMCFHVPTPRQNESIFQFLPVGGGPAYAAQAVSAFVTPSLSELTGGAGSAIHNMWADANDDVFNGKYYLQTINYTFTVTSTSNQPQNIRYRIDFVKPRAERNFRAIPSGATSADARNFRLPDALGSFNGILGPNNRVNPMYWTQVRKPIYFNVNLGRVHGQSTGNPLVPSVTTVQKHVKMYVNKVYNPRDIGTNAQDQNSAYLSIPDNQHIWCVVSNDFEIGGTQEGDRPDLRVTRQFSWRDRAGHAA